MGELQALYLELATLREELLAERRNKTGPGVEALQEEVGKLRTTIAEQSRVCVRISTVHLCVCIDVICETCQFLNHLMFCRRLKNTKRRSTC
jgi:hypothetical protein